MTVAREVHTTVVVLSRIRAWHPAITIAVGIEAGPAHHGAIVEGIGHATRRRRSRHVEGDVINIDAVIVVVHRAVLGVFPLVGMSTFCDSILFIGVRGITTQTAALFSTVDVEVELVVVGLGRDSYIEAHHGIEGNVNR